MPDSTAILWAVWLTAFATVGAALAAGWFGLRDRWTHLNGAAELPTHPHAAHAHSDAAVLIVELANRGTCSVVVTGAYWRVGWLKPAIVAVAVPDERLPLRIESHHGAAFPIVVNAAHRTLFRAARARRARVALIVSTTTAGEVRCGLSRGARSSIFAQPRFANGISIGTRLR